MHNHLPAHSSHCRSEEDLEMSGRLSLCSWGQDWCLLMMKHNDRWRKKSPFNDAKAIVQSCGVCDIVNPASTAGHGKNSITKRHLHFNSNCCQCFSLATLINIHTTQNSSFHLTDIFSSHIIYSCVIVLF